MDLSQYHLSNREARSAARTARVRNIDTSLSSFGARSFEAFVRSHNATHHSLTPQAQMLRGQR